MQFLAFGGLNAVLAVRRLCFLGENYNRPRSAYSGLDEKSECNQTELPFRKFAKLLLDVLIIDTIYPRRARG